MRTQKGITLVALVVTIIVLIILAGISISLLLGEHGILKMAKQSVSDYTNAQKEENILFSEFQEDYPVITIEDKETWTNDGKLVSIASPDGSTIKYTTDGSDPSESHGKIYDGPFKITENCILKVTHIKDHIQLAGEILTEEITKIDKNPPNHLQFRLEPQKTSIILYITEAEDTAETVTDGCSGIAEYRFKNNSGQWSDWTSDTTYTFREIYGDLAGVDCTIQAEVKDHAGNIIETAVSQTTKTTCLNSTYYTTNARQAIVSIASTDSYADYTPTKQNAGGAICGIGFFYYTSSRPVIAPFVISHIKSAASTATSNYRDLRQYFKLG